MAGGELVTIPNRLLTTTVKAAPWSPLDALKVNAELVASAMRRPFLRH
jgi:hypothetical protein